MDLGNKRVLVVGLGRSGVAAALFLKGMGARVTVSDSKSEFQLREEIPFLLNNGITVETGVHGTRTFQQQDLIVVSPGVPTGAPELVRARNNGIPVIGEVELASCFLKGHLAAITGSNGKTTTTSLVGDVLASGGHRTLVGGNIGTPAISLVSETTAGSYTVLEVSSFQLETIHAFRPEIAAVLNISPDHLDRHGSMEAYIAAKKRIFENQTEADWAILNADDSNCAAMAQGLRAQLCWFSRQKEVDRGAFVRDGHIVFRTSKADGGAVIMPVGEIALRGAHNIENVLAATCFGSIAGCRPEQIRNTVKSFRAVEHRLEHVATIRDVHYYNDSKATNVDATMKAVEAFPANIHLILGGKDKGASYSVLLPLLKDRVKRVYTIGAAAAKIESEIAGATPVTSAATLEAAVQSASAHAVPGDVVLLAPACASFDQFENYEHRGRVFKQLVNQIASKTGNRA
ncbi:MAG TPA: UDP-N-acetylmuramoyl-L-alanine--D-glutamate ligase [Terriglobales bacterium]|nr:UDP-N-acetylmuramoyl-L-alanine--D-glutamate ligase [Terriglobales bacterium]